MSDGTNASRGGHLEGGLRGELHSPALRKGGCFQVDKVELIRISCILTYDLRPILSWFGTERDGLACRVTEGEFVSMEH
jgi:hypothetical protein